MSDTMLISVLRMPIELWSEDELDKSQRHARYIQAADRIEQDKNLFHRIQAMAGNPNASEACRLIIKEIEDFRL